MPKSTKLTSNLFTFSLWLTSVFSGFVLMIYAYLGIFSRHLADDYCAIDFINTDFPTALWINYINVSDRFSNFMLITLSEAIRSPHGCNPARADAHPLGHRHCLAVVRVQPFQRTSLGQAPHRDPDFFACVLRTVAGSKPLPDFILALLDVRALCAVGFHAVSGGVHLAFDLRGGDKANCLYGCIRFSSLTSFIIGGFSEPTVLVIISLLALAIFCVWLWMKRPDTPNSFDSFDRIFYRGDACAGRHGGFPCPCVPIGQCRASHNSSRVCSNLRLRV